MAKMKQEQFRSVLEQKINDAYTWHNSAIRGEQRRNLQYYLGMPMGNEVDGRSQVVSWDVFETIEGALPDMVEAFFSGDSIGEFSPRGPEDEAFASQATDYVNWIVQEDNPGFLLFNTWLKDGLLSKVGIVRAKWVQQDPEKQEFKGLTEEQVTLMLSEDGVELLEASQYPAPLSEEQGMQLAQANMLPPNLCDVVIKRKKPGKVALSNVEPGKFIVSKGAKQLEDATLVGEFVTYTKSQLREMGFKAEQIKELKSYDTATDEIDPEADVDAQDDDADTSLHEVTLFEGFIRCDYNGDGIAEWRRVLVGSEELENEECDGHEYAVWTPLPIPHRVIGMAMADPVAPLQKLSTALTRQYVDSLFLANNPKTYVNMKAVTNIEDVISNRIGGVIRGNGPAQDAVQPIKTAMVATESLSGIELTQTMRERRSGMTRHNQGLEADSLNKTATGIQVLRTMGDKRLLLMLRQFAETGVKQLFRLVLKLVTRYQDMAQTVRLRNEFVTFDPRGWSAEMDVKTDVGLGTGDQSQTLAALQQFGVFMQQAAQVGLVTPQQVYEYGKALAKAAKLKGADEKFMLSPDKIQPKQTQPSPEQIKAQQEAQKLQFQAQQAMQKAQFEAGEAEKQRQHDIAMKRMELEQQQREKLLELASGYLMGQATRVGLMSEQPVNLLGGTQMDQNMQAPNVNAATIQQAGQVIQGLASQFQGGAPSV
jgi:hypothetical protein